MFMFLFEYGMDTEIQKTDVWSLSAWQDQLHCSMVYSNLKKLHSDPYHQICKLAGSGKMSGPRLPKHENCSRHITFNVHFL